MLRLRVIPFGKAHSGARLYAGRHLVATSSIAVGTVIVAEPPYAHALHADEMSARCDVTLTAGGLLRCSGCKHVWGEAELASVCGWVHSGL